MAQDICARIANCNSDAVIATDIFGQVCYWNEAAAELFGYEISHAMQQRVQDLLGPGLLPRHLRADGRSYECICQDNHGALVHVLASSRRLPGPEGEKEEDAILVCSLRDTSGLKVERDARLLEARFGELLESMPDAIVIMNALGRIVLTNNQAQRMFGHTPEDLQGQAIEILLPERLREAHVGHRLRYLQQPRQRPMGAGLELLGLRRDGREFPVEISLSPLETEEGVMVMSAIRDLSERSQAEQKFRSLLEAAPDAMTIVDSSGRIVLVNSQAERLFGYSRGELLQQNIELLIPERFQRLHPELREQFFQKPGLRPMGAGRELFARHRDGSEFPVEISLSPLETEEGLLVSASIRDVTERHRFEKALREKNHELERASQAKDRFLATMSHELRTPLNAIIGFTGTLLMRLPGPLNGDQEKQLRTVQSSARHLLSIINDLLDLAKIESGKIELVREPLVAQDVVREVVLTLRPAAEARGLFFECTLPDSDIVLHSDRRALQQILLNLSNNAIKFTEAGGVRIELRMRPPDLQHVEFVVIDTGIGIPEQDQGRLFRAFSQLNRPDQKQAEGTGLGLHLSQKLAELLGGKIRLDSVAGRGSRFTLSLKV